VKSDSIFNVQDTKMIKGVISKLYLYQI